MNFKEIYENRLKDAQEMVIKEGVYQPKMISGLISPESKIFFGWGAEFTLDKDGVRKIIGMFTERWNMMTDDAKNNFVSIMSEISYIVNKFFGGTGATENERIDAYDQADLELCLSEIEGKNIALCAERAAVGHQLVTILQEVCFQNYVSYYTLGSIITETVDAPHAFILLKNKVDPSKQYIFDIQNPLMINGYNYPALYRLTVEEYKDFEEGKIISPQSVYEELGATILGEKRSFGPKIGNRLNAKRKL